MYIIYIGLLSKRLGCGFALTFLHPKRFGSWVFVHAAPETKVCQYIGRGGSLKFIDIYIHLFLASERCRVSRMNDSRFGSLSEQLRGCSSTTSAAATTTIITTMLYIYI